MALRQGQAGSMDSQDGRGVGTRRRSPGYRLFVHSDAWADDKLDLAVRKRKSMVLQQLAVDPFVLVQKGCKDRANAGWLRVPLGGRGGNQFYLWWAPQGNAPVRHLGGGEQRAYVRAVRHHDDHTPLSAGGPEDYLELLPADLCHPGTIVQPWTEEQERFLAAEENIRVLYGWPGSGKTTVLNRAVETLHGGRVLYLTWSEQLADRVRQRLDVFRPRDVDVECLSFVRFVAALCGEDVPEIDLEESFLRFREAMGYQRTPSGWRNLEEALHAEIRARLIGWAVPGEASSQRQDGIFRLRDDAYRERRAGKDGLSDQAAKQVLQVFQRLSEDGVWSQIFPELAAAFRATEAVRAGRIPDRFRSFDQIVLDEVQDLTRAEVNLVTEFAKALAKESEAPRLLFAGDPGQTVRPSGFDHGVLGERVGAQLGRLDKQELRGSLRCPPKINAVIAQVGRFWSDLTRDLRPSGASKDLLPTDDPIAEGGEVSAGKSQPEEGRVFAITVPTGEEAVAFLEDLTGLTRTKVIVASARPPEWLPPHVRDAVLTPAEAKGLEYEAVVVLDPGKSLARFRSFSKEEWRLNEEQSRTLIDQLRVAISRASDCLAFLDVDASEEELSVSCGLLSDPEQIEPEAFLAERDESESSDEERVLSMLRELPQHLAARPMRAWRNARWLLRRVVDESVLGEEGASVPRSRVLREVLSVGLRLLAGVLPRNLMAEEVVETARRAALEWLGQPAAEAVDLFAEWVLEPSRPPYPLIDALLQLGHESDAFRAALGARWQTLTSAVTDGPRKASFAVYYSGPVEDWLGYLGRPNSKEDANRLRRAAARTLIAQGELKAAAEVCEAIRPTDRRLQAELDEARGAFERAAERFEQIGLTEEARRCWRRACDWERALALASGQEAEDLRWLLKVRGLLSAHPKEIAERLRKEELEALRGLWRDVGVRGGQSGG